MKLALMSCSNTGQDIIEALILSPVPFPFGVGEPTHLPMWLKTCSVGFVVAPTGVPLQGKKVTSPAVLVCSFENIIVQKNLSLLSEVREREDEKSSSSTSAVVSLWIKPYHQECSSQSWVFLCWPVWVCCLQEQMWPGRNLSWASKQLLPALVLGCSCRPAGVRQLGELGCSVLCAPWWALLALDQECLLSGLTRSCHSRVIWSQRSLIYWEAFQLSWMK